MSAVLQILQADNLDTDYRLQKQNRIFQEAGYSVSILHFHALTNHASKGVSKTGVHWRSVPLLSRRLFPSGKMLILKLLEQWLILFVVVLYRRPQICILHDDRFFGAIPFLFLIRKIGLVGKIYWDLRELPEAFLGRPHKHEILRWLIKMTDKTISASEMRKRYLRRLLRLSKGLYHIENVPDTHFAKAKEKSVMAPNSPYIYLQSPTEPDRLFYNTVAAVLSASEYDLVITGRVNPDDIAELTLRHGDVFRMRVHIAGLVPTDHLPHLLRQAAFSITLYRADMLNRRFCSPNRLFQAMALDCPVLTGSNPGLAGAIKRFGGGLCLEDDGTDLKSMTKIIQKIVTGRLSFPTSSFNLEAIRQETDNMQKVLLG